MVLRVGYRRRSAVVGIEATGGAIARTLKEYGFSVILDGVDDCGNIRCIIRLNDKIWAH